MGATAVTVALGEGTLGLEDGLTVQLEVPAGAAVRDLRALIEDRTGLPAGRQVLLVGGRRLLEAEAGQAVAALAGGAGELLVMVFDADLVQASGAAGAGAAADAGAGAGAGASLVEPRFGPQGQPENSAEVLASLRAAPEALARLRLQNPGMAAAVEAGDVENFTRALGQIGKAHEAERRRRQEELELLQADPFDPEAQARIAKSIQQKNIDDNYADAMENMPELFTQISMLWVNFEVNGVPMRSFVDSGAQSTIMSKGAAEKCGILRLMDTRMAGVAHGVGTATILGRIHQVPSKVAGHNIPLAITVVEQESMPFLFGLDNLRRFRCCIDLEKGELRFSSEGFATPFLQEHELGDEGIFSGEKRKADGAGDGGAPVTRQQLDAPGRGTPSGSVPAALAEPAAPAAPAVSSGSGPPEPTPEAVQKLVDLGFPREQARSALRQAGGNVEVAASLLFSALDS